MIWIYAAAACLAFSVTVATTPLVRRLAVLVGAVDFPDGKRKLHPRPTTSFGGLGIALGSPAYVVRLDQPTNTVTLGPRQALLHRGLIARQLAWLLDPPREPVAVQAKIRYTHPPAQATLEVLPHDQATLLFDEPQAAITPGQAVVFYRDDIVLGGGWINRWFDP